MENEMNPEMELNAASEEPAVEMPDVPEEAPAAQDVTAEVVNITGTANVVTAQTVTCTNGAIGTVKAESLTLNMQNGAVGGIQAQKVTLTAEQSAVGGVLAQEVVANNSQLVFVLANKISGDSKILFDLRVGLLAGVTAGLVITAFKLILGRRK